MERLGASVRELANEAFEEIMGYEPTHGDPALDAILGQPKDQSTHKPPRADIQKMKDIYDFYLRAQYKTDSSGLDTTDLAAEREWNDKYNISEREESYLRAYSVMYHEYHSAQAAFEGLATMIDSYNGVKDIGLGYQPSPEAKKAAGALLKKNEESHLPMLYPAIWKGLERLKRNHPESYKLFPWFVKQMKNNFAERLNVAAGGMPELRPGRTWAYEHQADITGEAGKVLSELRANNQIPQDFDINKLNLEQLESWLMEWKRDNREVEAQGKVVYEFHNGWTIQKLETPEALQFEGDEMGHCVGGYAHQVESGRTSIYSLRDEKGMPHVTMEIENPVGYKSVSHKPIGEFEKEDLEQHMPDLQNRHKVMPHFENEEQAMLYRNQYQHHPEETRRQWPDYLHEHGYPTPENPDDMDDMRDFEGVPLKKEFGVVQVQGKGNKTPKPEYQRMMREFLDQLRSKGIEFNRSDNWYGNWDDEYGDDSDRDPSSYRELEDWWENYQSDHKSWHNPREDAYGLPGDRKSISGGYIDDLIENTMYGLADVYDRGKDVIHDWAGAAQKIYHLMNIQYLQERVNTPERKESEKKQWLDEIQSAEEKLNEWTFDMHENNWEYIRERTEEEFKDYAEGAGIDLERYEDDLGNVDWDNVERDHEDDWNDVRDKVQQEDENNTYGDCYKFLNYLYHLIDQNGHVGPMGMPDPNQKDAGLPSYQKLMDNLNIPGTFS